MVKKVKVWEELNKDISSTNNGKFIIGGDFNALLDLSEKSGGINKIKKDTLGFKNFLHQIGAMDCTPTKGLYR